MSKEIILPEIGEGIASVEISQIMVKAGDVVQADDVIMVLESEKATMEIPATETGTVIELLVSEGDDVSPGTAVLKLEAVGGTSDGLKPGKSEVAGTPVTAPATEAKDPQPAPMEAEKPAAAPAPTASPAMQPIPQSPGQSGKTTPPLASPSVRKFARELGADLALITGSGQKGRISKEDVQAFIKNTLSSGTPVAAGAGIPQQPALDYSVWGAVRSKKLNRIRKLTAAHMSKSWQLIPHVTQYEKADITDLNKLIASLQKTNRHADVRVTLLPFMIRALIQALQEFPDFNSSLSADLQTLIIKEYYHIGIAVDTTEGLVVPVIRDADKKGIKDLTHELADLSNRARTRKLMPDELTGGTFTITSLGGIGGTYFSPIVNSPEVAILGISRYAVEPVYQNGAFVPRTILPFSLSYDHRVIDGAAAARFTGFLAKLLSDITGIKGLDLI